MFQDTYRKNNNDDDDDDVKNEARRIILTVATSVLISIVVNLLVFSFLLSSTSLPLTVNVASPHQIEDSVNPQSLLGETPFSNTPITVEYNCYNAFDNEYYCYIPIGIVADERGCPLTTIEYMELRESPTSGVTTPGVVVKVDYNNCSEK